MAFWTRVRLSGAAARAPNLPGRFTHQQSFQSVCFIARWPSAGGQFSGEVGPGPQVHQ